MRHALTVALQGFEGAIVMISHDRHLIKNTVDQFWLVDHGVVAPFEGDLDDYYEYIQGIKATVKQAPDSADEPKAGKKVDRQTAAAKRQQLKPLTNQIKKLDGQIALLCSELSKLDQQLSKPELYETGGDKLTELLKQQGQCKAQLEQAEEAWLAASEELEVLKQS